MPEEIKKPEAATNPPAATSPSPDDMFAQAAPKFTPREVPKKEDKPPEKAPAADAIGDAFKKVEGESTTAIAPDPKLPSGPKQLRDELARTQTELKTRNSRLTDLEAKIADYERRGKDTSALAEQASKLQERINELESDNRMLRQEASPEFKKQHDDRIAQVAEDAKAEVESFQVGRYETNEDGETHFQPSGNASWDRDFATLYQLPYVEAKNRAKAIFGDEWERVMFHYQELHRMQRDRDRALETERSTWRERETEQRAKMAQQREQFISAFKETSQNLADSVSDYKDADPEDKEVISARQNGYKVFDAAPQTLQQKIVKDAHIRHMVAAFWPMQIKLRRLEDENASLKQELEGRESGKPGATRRPASGQQQPSEKSWEQEAMESVDQ